MLYTTSHTGVVRGGTALSIVPDACTFEFEFRPLATDDVGSLVDEVMAHAREQLEPGGRSGRSPPFINLTVGYIPPTVPSIRDTSID